MKPDLARFIETLEESGLDFWRHAVDAMHEALVIVNPQREIVYVNRKAEAVIGAKLDEVQGRICEEALCCPTCRESCRLFEDGDFANVETEVHGIAGDRPQRLLKNGRRIYDHDGRLAGGIETFKDITQEVRERDQKVKRTELLVQEKNRSESLLNSLTEGVFVIDSARRIVNYSNRMAEITGHPIHEAIGRPLFELLDTEPPPDMPRSFHDIVGACWSLICKTREGQARPIEITFHAIRYEPDQILGLVRDLSHHIATALDEEAFSFQGIVSRSPRMLKVFRLIEKVAESDVTILIEGESGTGKELIARAVHRLSLRRDEPFFAVNCASFRGDLLLSELFGHEKGAFTGATTDKPGKLETAGNGTLLLDEVSEIPLEHQSLLLRVLEQREFERVGGNRKLGFGARVIAATNVRLADRVADGRFREDLQYRLRVIPIELPPLRERPEDIELLARYFLQRLIQQTDGASKRLAPEVIEALKANPWPGNVRELRNIVDYLYFIGGDEIRLADLPADVRPAIEDGRPMTGAVQAPELADERARIADALARARYRKSEAARLLGMDRTTLWRKLKKYGIS